LLPHTKMEFDSSYKMRFVFSKQIWNGTDCGS
jgi:hypothetical protein